MSDAGGVVSRNDTVPGVVKQTPVAEDGDDERTDEAHQIHEHQKRPLVQVSTHVVESTARLES